VLVVISVGLRSADGGQARNPQRTLFKAPGSVATDTSGHVYVLDEYADRVLKLSSDGHLLGQWGTRGRRPGQFIGPLGLTVGAQGDVYVADTGNTRIQTFSPAGHLLTLWSTGYFKNKPIRPEDVAVDRQGISYVTNTSNVQKYSPSGRLLTVFSRQFGVASIPSGIAVDGTGNVYVSLVLGSILKLSSSGKILATWGGNGPAVGQLIQAEGITVDRQGAVYVADTGNNRIQKFSPGGKVEAVFGTQGGKPGQFRSPYSVAVDTHGNLYVADADNARIQKLSPQGKVLGIWR
jgi:sugar lactone lactonase YvrE